MRLIFVCQQPIRKYFNNENFPIYGMYDCMYVCMYDCMYEKKRLGPLSNNNNCGTLVFKSTAVGGLHSLPPRKSGSTKRLKQGPRTSYCPAVMGVPLSRSGARVKHAWGRGYCIVILSRTSLALQKKLICKMLHGA